MQMVPDVKGYLPINGLDMYYEVHGRNNAVPLVLIHGGGSTIESSFGRIMPVLMQTRQVIALELQAHGRTTDRSSELSFEQDAADVVELLRQLCVERADIFGFSNGGQTALQISLDFPDVVNHLILASTFYKRDAVSDIFWEGFQHATLDNMPSALKQAFLNVNPDTGALQNMFDKDLSRMKAFKDWSEDMLEKITAKTLLIQGNKDVANLEHALEMHRLIKNSELVILPGAHGTYMGTAESLPDGKWTMSYFADLLVEFLDRSQ